jgi:hypothetical protein
MLTLAARMHDDLGDHAEKEILAEPDGEAEACPVVSVLQDLESIAVELDVSVKIHLVESFQGDLVLAMVLELVGAVLEGEVVLDRPARIFGLFVLSGADCRGNHPEAGEDGKGGNEAKEYGRLKTASDLPRQP